VYGSNYGERPHRRWVLGIASALVGAGVVLGAYCLGASGRTQEAGGGSGLAPAPPATQVPTALPVAAPSTDPVQSATAWLRAYRSLAYSDPEPGAWADRVAPVVTDTLAEQYQAYRVGTAGADWAEYVNRMCVTTVDGAGGVIPDEAPRTADTVSVQVGGIVTTRCADYEVPPQPDETVGATVNLRLGGDGFWRVEKRLY
jgi:hypothetical protein